MKQVKAGGHSETCLMAHVLEFFDSSCWTLEGLELVTLLKNLCHLEGGFMLLNYCQGHSQAFGYVNSELFQQPCLKLYDQTFKSCLAHCILLKQ